MNTKPYQGRRLQVSVILCIRVESLYKDRNVIFMMLYQFVRGLEL